MTQMSNLMGKPPLGLKKTAPKKDGKRLARVHEMPCVICQTFGEPQRSPTQAHHCIHDRHSFAKRPDSETIPLCEGHHQGMFDTSKLALHRAPKQWREKYGPDWSYLTTAKKP